MKTYLLIALALFVLAACDKPQPPEIIKPQRDALEKAKSVEQTLQQNADETRKKIDQAENP